jgi:hypothetical protein
MSHVSSPMCLNIFKFDYKDNNSLDQVTWVIHINT